MSLHHRDEHGYPLDPATELLLADAAELCGVSTKTLRRDAAAGDLAAVRRDGRNYVTVEALIDAGRYSPGAIPPSEIRELAALRLEAGELRARNAELTALLASERELCRRSDEAVGFLQRIVERITVEGRVA